MAGGFSDYTEKKVLDQIFGATAWTAPATLYVGLLTDSNTATQRDANTVTEVSGSAYARVAVTNNTTNWPNASGTLAQKQNGTAINFPTPTGSWGTVNAWAVYDAVSAGNLIAWADLDTPQAIASGNSVSFDTSSNRLTITLD